MSELQPKRKPGRKLGYRKPNPLIRRSVRLTAEQWAIVDGWKGKTTPKP